MAEDLKNKNKMDVVYKQDIPEKDRQTAHYYRWTFSSPVQEPFQNLSNQELNFVSLP